MFLVVVVASCDTAYGYLVTLGRGLEPGLLDLVGLHHFISRVVFEDFIRV